MPVKAKIYLLLGAAVLATAGLWVAVLPSYGQNNLDGDPLQGGRLYYAWDQVLEVDLPGTNQPIWEEIAPGEEFDPRSWRCVTCHGWDYSGSDGRALRAIVKQAGFPGIFSMVAESEEVIIAWLNGVNNQKHDFSELLSEEDLKDISAFLSSGLVAPELIADLETREALGTLSTGETLYQEYCLSCHGVDGEKLNFGVATVPLYLSDIAWRNPWQVAHVVRFGHIQTNMPAAEAVDLAFSQQIDLLAYTQSLPQAHVIGSPDYPVIEYDNQADTEMLAYTALALVVVILGGTFWVLRRQQ
jgi:mono/diheme cytochrome c family protein